MGAPVNTVTYGSYTFSFVTLDELSQARYGEDGFTRVGSTKFFTITGWIGGINQADLENKIGQMEDQLRRPRQTFIVSWAGDGGSSEFYHIFNEAAAQTSQQQDLDWGPKPGELRFTRFTGGRAALYRWTVGCTVMDKNLTSDVLAVSFQWSHRVDASGFTTRTAMGKILIEGGTVQSGQSADHYRAIVTNAIPALTWFQFKEADYDQSPDGRVLSFTWTDQEQLYTFPKPVTEGHVSWMVRTPGIQAGSDLMADYILTGFFKTSANHTKNELFQCIFDLISLKFGKITGQLIWGERVFREDVYAENRIDFTVAARAAIGAELTDSDVQFQNLIAGLETFGLRPPNVDGQPQTINPYGQTEGLSSGAVAPSPLQYDATTAGVDETGGYSFTSGTQQPPNTINTNYAPRQVKDSSGNDPVNKGISKRHIENPVIAFHEEISYQFVSHIAVFVPKKLNADPIVQQTGMPTAKIIQAGYMTQVATKPDDLTSFASAPVYDPTTWAVEDSYVSLPNAEPIGDGTLNAYTTHWRYVLAGRKNTVQDTSKFVLPLDPRRTLTTAEGIDPTKFNKLTTDPNTST